MIDTLKKVSKKCQKWPKNLGFLKCRTPIFVAILAKNGGRDKEAIGREKKREEKNIDGMRNGYSNVAIKNSVKNGLVTMPRIYGCRQRGSWDTLHPSGLKYREVC